MKKYLVVPAMLSLVSLFSCSTADRSNQKNSSSLADAVIVSKALKCESQRLINGKKDVIVSLLDEQNNITKVMIEFADGSIAPEMVEQRPLVWVDSEAVNPKFKFKLVIQTSMKLATLFERDANFQPIRNDLFDCQTIN